MNKNPSAARVKRPLPRLSISGFLLLAMLVMPLAAHAQGGSPFDSGLTAMQTLFTGTIAKVTSLIAIVLGRVFLRARRTRCEEDPRRSCSRQWDRCSGRERPDLALGCIAFGLVIPLTLYSPARGLMSELQTRRRNRVYKALHKPLMYLGVERTVFYFVCVGAVVPSTCSTRFLPEPQVFVGGYIFGRWATTTDPAFLKIMGKSERFKTRYDAAKQEVPNVEVR